MKDVLNEILTFEAVGYQTKDAKTKKKVLKEAMVKSLSNGADSSRTFFKSSRFSDCKVYIYFYSFFKDGQGAVRKQHFSQFSSPLENSTTISDILVTDNVVVSEETHLIRI